MRTFTDPEQLAEFYAEQHSEPSFDRDDADEAWASCAVCGDDWHAEGDCPKWQANNPALVCGTCRKLLSAASLRDGSYCCCGGFDDVRDSYIDSTGAGR